MSDEQSTSAPQSTRRLEASPFEPAAATPVITKPAITPAKIGMALIAMLVAYLLFFLLTARSIEVDVNASSDAEVSIAGLTIPFGDRFLARPGNYEFSVKAEGYRPYLGELEVTSADSQTRSVVLQPLPGTLSLNSNPPGAAIALNGQSIGTTPATLKDVEAGELSFEFSLDRYQLQQSTF